MPDTLSPITKAQDQIIQTIQLVQDRVLDTNQKVATTLNERVPAVVTARLGDLPRPELPAPADAVDNYFKFVERVTTANHKFATGIVKVWTPAPAATPEPAQPVAEEATAKSPAKKAPAAKRAAKKPAAKSTK